MEPGALAPYEHSLRTGSALEVQHLDGRTHTLDVRRWLDAADPVDLAVVERARGLCLDVGCGPGRIVEALRRGGRFALGIDIAPKAVALTRRRGQNALLRDVFRALPAEGRWGTVLLLDGNVGIGGDVARLLRRATSVLVPGGLILVETHPDDDVDESGRVRFAIDGTPLGPDFAWSLVGRHRLHAAARAQGLAVEEEWHDAGRAFTTLVTERS